MTGGSISELQQRIRELERELESERTLNLQQGHRYVGTGEAVRLQKENDELRKMNEQQVKTTSDALHKEAEAKHALRECIEMASKSEACNQRDQAIEQLGSAQSQYRSDIATLQKRLQQSDICISQLENCRRLDQMANEKLIAQNARQAEAIERRDAEIKAVARNNGELSITVGVRDAEIKRLEQGKANLAKVCKAASKQIDELKVGHARALEARDSKINEQVFANDNLCQRIGQQENELTELRIEVRRLNGHINKLDTAGAKPRMELEADIRKLRRELETARQGADNVISVKDFEIKSLRGANGSLADTIREKDAKIHGMAGQIRELNVRVADLFRADAAKSGRIEEHENTIRGLRSFGAQLERERTDYGNQIDSKDLEIKNLLDNNGSLAYAVRKHEERIAELAKAEMFSQDRVQRLKHTIDELRSGEEFARVTDVAKSQQASIEVLEERIRAELDASKRLNATIVNLDNKVCIRERQIEELKAKIEELKALAKSVRDFDASTIKGLETTIKELEATIVGLKVQEKVLRDLATEAHSGEALSRLRDCNNEQRATIKRLDARVKELETALKETREANGRIGDQWVSKIRELETVRDEHKICILQLNEKLAARIKEVKMLRSLSFTGEKLTEAEGKIKELEAELARWKSGKTFDAEIKELTKDQLAEEAQELRKALDARIREVKMLRGFRGREADERVQTLIAERNLRLQTIKELRAELKRCQAKYQFRKNVTFGVLYGRREGKTGYDFENNQLRVQARDLDNLNQGLNEAIKRLQSQVAYHKATAEKRLDAIKVLQQLDARVEYKEAAKAVLHFCEWITERTGDEGWRGCNLVGKLDWAKKFLEAK